MLCLVAVGLAVLATPEITRPIDRYRLGEFTTRAVRAPYDVSVVDVEATRQQRAAAYDASPIIGRVDAGAGGAMAARFARAWAPLEDVLAAEAGEAAVGSAPKTGSSRHRTDAWAKQADAERQQHLDEAFAEVQRRLDAEIPEDVRAAIATRADFARMVDGFRRLVAEASRTPIVASVAEFGRLAPAPPRDPGRLRVVLVDTGTGRESAAVDAGQLRETPAARAALEARAPALLGDLPPPAVAWLASLASAWLGPTVTPDPAVTLERRRAAANAVLPVSIAFRRNELIVGEGQPVTRQALLVLEALRQQRVNRDTWRNLVGRAGVLLSLLLAAFSTLLRRDAREAGAVHFAYLVTSLVVTAVAFRMWLEVGASLALRYPGLPEPAFVIAFPAAAAVMYARTVVPFYAATLYLGVQSVCLGVLWELDLLYVIYLLVSGGVAGLLASRCSRRQCLVRAGALAGLAMAPLAACLTLLTDAQGAPLFWTTVGGVVGCVLSGIGVLAIGPLFEWAFGHMTRIRLVELMNYQHPLLRRITEATPGTFQHSVTVGLLADAAATAIGADALLARVGALYHDAGKTERPDCFTENQQGANPHDQMSPRDSARAIIDHVEAGARLVADFGLGPRVADFVREHHGTSATRSILVKAQQAGEAVNPADFRYPGPRPRSRETGILMIADQVEATARAMDDVSEDALRAMVRATVERIQDERQLDECPLTMQELAMVGDALTQALSSVHHRRIKYPTATGVASV